MININKLEEIYLERTTINNGYTFVVNKWDNLVYFFNIISSLNKELEDLLPVPYESYNDNLHITVLGLNEYANLSTDNQKEVKILFSEFPTLQIDHLKFILLQNGLIIVEIFLSDTDAEELKKYRESFEKYGIHYKYPEKNDRMHLVLGIFNPFELKKLEEGHKKEKISEIQKILEQYTIDYQALKAESIFLTADSTQDIHYQLTSLKLLDDSKSNGFLQKLESYKVIKETKVDALKEKKNEINTLLADNLNYDLLKIEVNKYKKDFINDNKIPKTKEEINSFWRKIDLQILYNLHSNIEEFSFNKYNFPEFNKTSFLPLRDDDGYIVFNKIAIFLMANFHGKVNFNKSFFKHKVNFNLVHFYYEVEMKSCRFLGETYFRKTYFNKNADFEASYFENVALDGITFPHSGKIKMVRTSFEKVIWSNFINSNDVVKIESERETFARLKQANSERGNFIDSNLFFVEESNIYLKDSLQKLFCNPNKKEDPNKKCPKWSKKIGFLGDVISFGMAKITSHFGQSWFLPLGWFLLLFTIGIFSFEPNRDFIATPATPKFLLVLDKSKSDVREIEDIKNAYYAKNYYDGYNFEFQNDSNKKLFDTLATRSMYVFGSLAPTVIASNQWFSTIKQDRFAMRASLTILFWYFIGAFLYAIKNRTRRV